MAQKDIEAIAEQMRCEEQAKHEQDLAYEKAQAELQQLEDEEFEQIEDEIISPAAMGFIDSEYDEADDSGCCDENEDSLDEAIDDCLPQDNTIDEAEGQGSIEVDVYNEDGYGRHFASEVMKNIPGVTAVAKKTPRPNGDIIVKISGMRPDLEKAFAFYVGARDYSLLPQDDKEEFESLLVFDDGDTLAEADYREAVAHCLDPIGVNASTADLVSQDTCAINVLREEKMRRKVKKINTALLENDLSKLSDEEIEQTELAWKETLEAMGHTPESWEKLSPEAREKAWSDFCERELVNAGEIRTYGWKPEDKIFMDAMAKELGFTLQEFLSLSPKQQEAITKNHMAFLKFKSPTGKGFNYSIAKDPKTGKYYKYYNAHVLPSALGGGITAFNPFYSQEDSVLQHPSIIKKREKEAIKQAEQQRRDELAKASIKRARGKETWNQNDWTSMIVNLSPEEKDEMMKELIDEVRSEAPDKLTADREEAVIKFMFGKTQKGNNIALKDLGIAWGDRAPSSIIRLQNVISDVISQAMKKTVGSTVLDPVEVLGKMSSDPVVRSKFIKVLSNELNALRLGKNPTDPERGLRHKDWLKMIRDMGYSPTTWDKLSTDRQIELMDKYYETHGGKDAMKKMGYIADVDD